MKLKTTLFIALLIIGTALRAQITLEHNYSGTAELADVENFGYKYFVTDYLNNSVLIYNEDHTPWKTVNLNLGAGSLLYDIAYVSSKVFNQDDLVEMLMVSYIYVATTDTTGYFVYTTTVVNESGTTLLTVPGGVYSSTFTVSNSEPKLMVYIYDFSISSYISATEIYSLPTKPAGLKEPEGMLQLPYPNPAETSIRVFYPESTAFGEAEIIVSDLSGKEMGRYQANTGGSMELPVSGLPSGNYIYRLSMNGKSIPAGKFVVR
ncbi:MAG: T9SS type A sorting domain-containing protein [Bacteroidales bacterium]|nr:T9SS type A sorting domain-containing protein [Bacteroidales bacterium]